MQENIPSFPGSIIFSWILVVLSCTCVPRVIRGIVSASILSWPVPHLTSIPTHSLLVSPKTRSSLLLGVVHCCRWTSRVYDMWICVIGVSFSVDDARLLHGVSSSILSSWVSYLISVIYSWASGIGSHSFFLECLVRIMNDLPWSYEIYLSTGMYSYLSCFLGTWTYYILFSGTYWGMYCRRYSTA
jgi:hypothetical protein